MNAKSLLPLIFVCMLPFLLYLMRPLSVKGRLLIWNVCCEMIKDKPILGFGTGGVEGNYLYYQAAYLQNNVDTEIRYLAGNTHIVFNEFIKVSVEHGILGLILYLFLIFIVIRQKTYSLLTLKIAKSILLLILMQGVFGYPSVSMPIMFIVIIALAMINRVSNHVKSLKINIKKVVIGLLIFLLPSVRSCIVYYKFNVCIRDKSLSIKEKQKYIHSFFNYLQNDNTFLMFCIKIMSKDDNLLSLSINKLKQSHPSPDVFIKEGDRLVCLGQFKEAERSYLLASDMVPSKQEARVRLSLLYNKMGRYAEAKQLAKSILNERLKNYSFRTYELHEMLKRELQIDQ